MTSGEYLTINPPGREDVPREVVSRFSRRAFEAWLNHDFHVRAYGELAVARATLISVTDAANGNLERFTVEFRGDDLPIGLCGFAHRSGLHFALYLEPGNGAESAAFRYATIG